MTTDPTDVHEVDESVPSIGGNARDAEPFPYYVPITQFVLRILGVYLFVLGISDAIGEGWRLASAWLKYRDLWHSDTSVLYSYSFSRFVGSAVLVIVGAYFALGGRWVIEKVFLPPAKEEEESNGT